MPDTATKSAIETTLGTDPRTGADLLLVDLSTVTTETQARAVLAEFVTPVRRTVRGPGVGWPLTYRWRGGDTDDASTGIRAEPEPVRGERAAIASILRHAPHWNLDVTEFAIAPTMRVDTRPPSEAEIAAHQWQLAMSGRSTGPHLPVGDSYIRSVRVEHDTPEPVWEVQRYDSAWGGFRAMPTAFDNDDPARFTEKKDAIAAVQLAAENMAEFHRFRVYNVRTGNIVGFVRRNGKLEIR